MHHRELNLADGLMLSVDCILLTSNAYKQIEEDEVMKPLIAWRAHIQMRKESCVWI